MDDKSSISIVAIFGKVSLMHLKPFTFEFMQLHSGENIKMILIILRSASTAAKVLKY